MMAHPRSRRRRGGREIESTRWSGATQSFLALSAGSQALNFISASSDPPETLMRLRGELVATLDGVQAPTSLIDVGVGIALVPEGSSTTVLWSPLTDSDAPWWFYSRFVIGYEEMVADNVDVPQLTSFRQTVDLKAMRIIRPDVEAQIVVEQATLAGSAAINVVMSARALFGST